MAAMTTLGAQARTNTDKRLSGFDSIGPKLDWRIVNDNVMGGRSDGEFVVDADTLVFTGSTNTNGGGFSSIRAEPLSLDLQGFDGIRLRVKGDGRRYTWRLASSRRWRGIGVGYWAQFDTIADTWVTVDLPFDEFIAQVRGQRLQGPDVDPSNIAGVGLMIYDGKDGPFRIELEGVYAYGSSLPALEALRWKKRVLVVSAPSSEDPQFLDQITSISGSAQAGSDDPFRERDLELVVLHDDDDSAAASALRERLQIAKGSFAMVLVGKDGGVKRVDQSPVNIQDIYGLIDTMPMRQQEMKSPDRR